MPITDICWYLYKTHQKRLYFIHFQGEVSVTSVSQMIKMFGHVLVCFFCVLSLLLPATSFLCRKNNCGDCVNSRFIKCRWCKRDSKCHTPGAIATNPCKSAENIVQKSHCGNEFSYYDPDLSYKMLLLSAVADIQTLRSRMKKTRCSRVF